MNDLIAKCTSMHEVNLLLVDQCKLGNLQNVKQVFNTFGQRMKQINHVMLNNVTHVCKREHIPLIDYLLSHDMSVLYVCDYNLFKRPYSLLVTKTLWNYVDFSHKHNVAKHIFFAHCLRESAGIDVLEWLFEQVEFDSEIVKKGCIMAGTKLKGNRAFVQWLSCKNHDYTCLNFERDEGMYSVPIHLLDVITLEHIDPLTEQT